MLLLLDSLFSGAGVNHSSAFPAAFPSSGVTFHPTLGQVRYSIREIAEEPDQQVDDTIQLMRQYVSEDQSDNALQQDVSQSARSGDPIIDTYSYLRRNGDRGMRFVRDEITAAPFADYESAIAGRWRPMVESLARPELLAKVPDPHGDCDCFCMYGAAHLLLRGVPCAFVTVAADHEDPSIYTHVYLAAYPESGPYAGQRVPLDLSHGPYPGWEVREVYRRREWPVSSMGPARLLCLGAALFGAGALAYSALRRERLFA